MWARLMFDPKNRIKSVSIGFIALRAAQSAVDLMRIDTVFEHESRLNKVNERISRTIIASNSCAEY